MRAPKELLPVLTRLAEVLRQLSKEEEAKAGAASAGHHDQLDGLLADEQALILEFRGLEQKRLSILEDAGFKDSTLRELLEQEDEDGRLQLSPLFDELTEAAEQLKSMKDSADRILKVRLRQISLFSATGNGPHYDMYG